MRRVIIGLSLLAVAGCAKNIKGEAIASAMDKVWNEGDLTVLDEAYAPDAVNGVREFVVEHRALYPDITISVDDYVVSGPQIVTMWSATGTHKDLGKKVTIRGVSIRRIEDRKIVEEVMFYDQKAVYDQLGFQLIAPDEATPFGPLPEIVEEPVVEEESVEPVVEEPVEAAEE